MFGQSGNLTFYHFFLSSFISSSFSRPKEDLKLFGPFHHDEMIISKSKRKSRPEMILVESFLFYLFSFEHLRFDRISLARRRSPLGHIMADHPTFISLRKYMDSSKPVKILRKALEKNQKSFSYLRVSNE